MQSDSRRRWKCFLPWLVQYSSHLCNISIFQYCTAHQKNVQLKTARFGGRNGWLTDFSFNFKELQEQHAMR